MSHVLITGAAGFLGQRLVNALLSQTERPINKLILWDHQPGSVPSGTEAKIVTIQGDLLDEDLRRQAFADRLDVVIHLAAVVSSEAEADFDLGMRINVDGTRALLEACRTQGNCPVFIMTSSVAVFGGDLPTTVPDNWQPAPQSSYGAEKAICERLVSEYCRRGFVDGRVLRLPTIAVRPGKPNRAASSFVSSVIREPLNGEGAVCAVAPETPLWLMSPNRAVEAMVHVLGIPASALGSERVLSLPGVSVRTDDWIAALGRATNSETMARVAWDFDPDIAAIVQSWPGEFEATRAKALGFEADAGEDEIIAAYMAEQKNI